MFKALPSIAAVLTLMERSDMIDRIVLPFLVSVLFTSLTLLLLLEQWTTNAASHIIFQPRETNTLRCYSSSYALRLSDALTPLLHVRFHFLSPFKSSQESPRAYLRSSIRVRPHSRAIRPEAKSPLFLVAVR